MLAGSQSADVHRQVSSVARVLYATGAVSEGIALLRGAKAREGSSEELDGLLAQMVAGERVAPQQTCELDLALVDAWIRRGMLVEALALLGGTSLGTAETGQEWANLLGELLAPVPVDAEPTLLEMHRQLLGGGAGVALALLEDRTKTSPGLPAWALRRLEVLRWMLLDNASTAESDPTHDGSGPTELARTILRPLVRRNVRGALEAARAFAASHPEDRDAARAAEALATLHRETERQAAMAEEQLYTVPMYGAPAAAMQLRMGNVTVAAAVYRNMLDESPDDDHVRLLLADVEAVLAAMEGRPVADDELPGERTQQAAAPHHDDHAPGGTLGSVSELIVPQTAAHRLPAHDDRDAVTQRLSKARIAEAVRAAVQDESGPVAIGGLPSRPPGAPEGGSTGASPPPSRDEAARLAQRGRYVEAAESHEALAARGGADEAGADEGARREELTRATDRCRARAARGDGEDVLVRGIVWVE